MEYIPNNLKVEVKDYPYGYNVRTTLYNYVEHNPKYGYRCVTQTINPKTGKLNKPKKGIYFDFLIRYYNENRHIKIKAFHLFRGEEAVRELSTFVGERLELFSLSELEYIASSFNVAVVHFKLTERVHGNLAKDYLDAKYKPLLDAIGLIKKDLWNPSSWLSL